MSYFLLSALLCLGAKREAGCSQACERAFLGDRKVFRRVCERPSPWNFVVGPKPPCGALSSMPEKRSAKQNGRKCRAQWVSAEAAPSTSGRKEGYGDDPHSLIHCGEDGTRSNQKLTARSVETLSLRKGRADPRKMLVAQRHKLQLGFGPCRLRKDASQLL